MKLKRDIDLKLKAIEDLLDKPNIDDEIQQDAEEDLQDVYQEIVALQSEKSFRNHMSKYITDAYTERQNGERGPLCTCPRATCSLTEGRTPPQVRTRGSQLFQSRSTRDLVSEFLQDHRGAEVLHEMREAWEQREGDLYLTLSRVHARLERADRNPRAERTTEREEEKGSEGSRNGDESSEAETTVV